MRRRVVIAGSAVVALLVLAGAVLLFHDAVAGAVIRAVAGGMGYELSYRSLAVGFSGARAAGVRVLNHAGEPVLAADQIDVAYALSNVLPGSNRRRFGISALDIQRPTVTLIHHPDGTYNVAFPSNAANAKPDTTPIDMRIRVRDGSVVFLDRYIVPGAERRQRIVGLAADAVLAPHAHSFYNVRFDLDDGRTLHPVYGKATFDADRGFEAQRWTAADLPIGPLIDFGLSSHVINVVDGQLRDVDARIYTFVDPDGTTHPHIGVRAQLTGGKIYVAGLVKPLRGAHGTLLAYDDGITTRGLDATLAGIPLHVAGGVYGIGAPKVQFGLSGGGELAQLQQAIAPAQRQPVTGNVVFDALALGSLQAPVISATFSAPAMTFRSFRFTQPSSMFLVHGHDLDILRAGLHYGPVAVDAHGTVTLEKNVQTNLVAGLHADGDRLPYVAQLVPGLQLDGVVHLQGTGTRIGGTGILSGTSPDGRLDALVAVDGNGDGVVGPFSIERRDGASLYARVALARSKQSALAIVDAHRFSLLPAKAVPPLPGLPARSLAVPAGTLDAQLVGAVDASRLDGLSGHVRLSGLRYGAIAADARIDLGTTGDGDARGDVHLHSTLGTLDGNAAYAGGLVGFTGALHSSFAQLAPLTKNLHARGSIDGPLLALSDGPDAAIQTSGLTFRDASVAGVPIRNASVTAVVHDPAVDVRALQVGVAGGTVTALGALGSGGTLDATSSALSYGGAVLRLFAHVRGALDAPSADLGVLVQRANLRGIGVSANAFAHYANGTLHLTDATALALDSYAGASGTLAHLDGGGTPALDLDATLHGAQIAPLARALHVPLKYPEGELDAVLHATGPLGAPQIAGTVSIPRGSLNGLDFSNASVAIAGTAHDLAARNGTVKVGTTTIAFAADASPARQHVILRAPRLDLADFDDYFDTADTLAGKGRLDAAVTASNGGVATHGSMLIANARFRRFSVGDVDANWQTAGRTVHANGDVRSDHGSIAMTAALTFPAGTPLADLRRRATVSADATLADLDLSQWLPTAGINVPVTGVGSGAAHLSGTLAAPAFSANARVANAVVAGYPLTAFALSASGNAHAARIDALHVAGAGLTADASGTFGYGPSDPIAIALHAQSADVAVLAKALKSKLDVSGAIDTTLDLAGTRDAPRAIDTLDGTNLRDGTYTLPRLHARLVADRQTLQLQQFEADLQRGRITAVAALPIQFAPIGLRNAPLAASITADDVELAQFAQLLSDAPSIAGRIDGTLAASGMPSDPAVGGALTLADASYSSKFLRSAVKNGRARLELGRQTADLTGVHVDVGGGAIDGNLNATFGDLRDLQRTLAIDGEFVAKNADIDAPNLFRGQIDGTLAVQKQAGRIPSLAGSFAFSKTRLDLAALIPKAPANPNEHPRPTVAFDLDVALGNDVRVQGPGVDVGARGAIHVGGNLAHPQLDGRIASTDGTLSFYRTFVLHQAVVSFQPSDGIIPNVDATATTTITNPDTSILLHVTGPATNLNLDLASNPSYDREQILGLLVNAQALGAVPGVETTAGGGGINAEAVAGGFLSTEFTQNLLQPVGSSIGQALGFEDLALGYSFGNGLSAGARKQLSKKLYVTFNQEFGGDERQSIALNYDLPHNGAAVLTAYNAGNQAPSILHTQQLFTPAAGTNFTLQALEPPPGTAGVVLTYQRKF